MVHTFYFTRRLTGRPGHTTHTVSGRLPARHGQTDDAAALRTARAPGDAAGERGNLQRASGARAGEADGTSGRAGRGLHCVEPPRKEGSGGVADGRTGERAHASLLPRD